MPRERSEADEDFKERKLTLRHRLEREGRWGEASRFKEEVRKGCREKGLSANASLQVSWDKMEESYPPLSEAEMQVRKEHLAAARAARRRAKRATGAAGELTSGAVEGNEELNTRGGTPPSHVEVNVDLPPPDRMERRSEPPAEWGELPDNASQVEEVKWVYANYMRVVRRTREGHDRVQLKSASCPAPSHGTFTLLNFAITNQAGFLNLWQKVCKDKTEGEEEQVKKEKKSIAEIRAIIEQMEEVETNA